MTIIPKELAIREEDYWLIPLSGITVLFVAFTIFASVLTFRVPALLISALGLWFTTAKINKGYGKKHARVHIASILVLGFLLFFIGFILTN